MPIRDESMVGKKGEILPKKSIRNFSGINPGDKILIEAYPNKIIINKILSIDEAFELPTISKGSPKEIEKELDEEGKYQEELQSNGE